MKLLVNVELNACMHIDSNYTDLSGKNILMKYRKMCMVCIDTQTVYGTFDKILKSQKKILKIRLYCTKKSEIQVKRLQLDALNQYALPFSFVPRPFCYMRFFLRVI